MSQSSLLPQAGSHFISLTKGVEMTTLYRSQKETVLSNAYRDRAILPICETFAREDIDILLEKEDCKALRIYFGMDASLKVKVLIVAVNSNGDDILPSSTNANLVEGEE